MDKTTKEAIEEYQCVGCADGSFPTCYEKGDFEECNRHVPGTMIPYIGKVFLGMPTGFNRLCRDNSLKIKIFKTYADFSYDKFNVPAWKYLNEKGHTLVRGLMPRINTTFLHIFLEDCRNRIPCLEITNKDLSEMD